MLHTFNSSIIAISGDPGGARALAEVLQKIRECDQYQLRVYAYNEACDIYKNGKIPYIPLKKSISEQEIIDILQETTFSLMITSTSHNQFNLEKKFLASAKRLSIPSLAILDFWCNYSVRFSKETDDLSCLPDKIAIMDSIAFDQMIQEGFPADRLIITGQPAYDRLPVFKNRWTDRKKAELRNHFGADPHSIIVLFASDPLSKMKDGSWGVPIDYGFTEKTVIPLVISALEEIAKEIKRDIILVIALHPRDEYREYLAYTSERIRILVSDSIDTKEIALSADLVTGMNTNLLVEACLLGCIVASIQPNLSKDDILPINKNGLSTPVYHEEDIKPVLQNLLCNSPLRNSIKKAVSEYQGNKNAGQNVLYLIHRMLTAKKNGV